MDQGTITKKELDNRSFILITGHIKVVTYAGPFEYPEEEMYYFFDTSVVIDKEDNRNNFQFPRAIRGQGQKDHRIGVIKFEEGKGYTVSVNPSSSNFYRWSRRYRFADIQ